MVPQLPGSVRGQILDPSGQPFGGGYTIAVKGDERKESLALRTQAWAAFLSRAALERLRDGRFELSPIAEERLAYVLRVKGYSDLDLKIPESPGSNTVTLPPLRLARATGLTMALRTELTLGQLPRELCVRLQPVHEGTPSEAVVRTEPVGLNRPAIFRSLWPGPWRATLQIGADRRRHASLGSTTVELDSDPNNAEFSLHSASVSGRVTGEDGAAIPEAQVSVHQEGLNHLAASSSDLNGTFRLEFVHASGNVQVRARRGEGDLGAEIEGVDLGSAGSAEALHLVLPNGAVHIRTVNLQTEIAVTGVEIEANVQDEKFDRGLHLKTDSAGETWLRGLSGSTIRLVARHPEYEDAESVVAVPEGKLVEAPLRLRRTARLHGHVVDSSGTPVAGASIMGPLPTVSYNVNIGQFMYDWRPTFRVSSSADGSFEVPVSTSNSSYVAYWSPGYRLSFAPLQAGDEGVSLPLSLMGADTPIQVVWGDGRPYGEGLFELWRDGHWIPDVLLREAFADSGCPQLQMSRQGALAVGGCLMPSAYAAHAVYLFRNRMIDSYLGTIYLPNAGGVTLLQVTRPE
jgi:hypothetical protein